MQIHIIIHNIGHHDFYILAQEPDEEAVWLVPINVQMKSIGKKIMTFLDQPNIHLKSTERADQFEFSQPLNNIWSKKPRFENQKTAVSLSEKAVFLRIMLPIYVPVLLKNKQSISSPVIESEVKRKVLLFSKGPAEGNAGRSTQYIASIIKKVSHHVDSTIEVHNLHDYTSEEFTYKGRPRFFRNKVLPKISQIRDELVKYHRDKGKPKDWQNNFSVFLSLNTGTTPVIISTLNALQRFQPRLYAAPEAKKWPSQDGMFSVKEFSHNYLQQSPPIPIEDIDDHLYLKSIEAMKIWAEEFKSKKPKREKKDGPELSFFFRKGRQEVLAIVMVKGEDGIPTPVRGVNLEVSLPTGSLCAERNAIGSALIANPLLKREDILCVAVLCLKENKPTLGPCGACKEWLSKVAEVNPEFSVITFKNDDCSEVFIDSL
jgi:cytidine deaminase